MTKLDTTSGFHRQFEAIFEVTDSPMFLLSSESIL
jgi:hypothetical protein